MARTSVMLVAAALLLGMNSGCGTMANLQGRTFFTAICVPSRPPIPLGGAGTDVFVIGKAFVRPLGRDGTWFFATMALIDLPFSLVGDVVTLPWASYEFVRETSNPTGKYVGPPFPPTENAKNAAPEPILGAPRTETPDVDALSKNKSP